MWNAVRGGVKHYRLYYVRGRKERDAGGTGSGSGSGIATLEKERMREERREKDVAAQELGASQSPDEWFPHCRRSQAIRSF